MTAAVILFLAKGGSDIIAHMSLDPSADGQQGRILKGKPASVAEGTAALVVLSGSDVVCHCLDLPAMSRSKQARILPALYEDLLASRSGSEHFAIADVDGDTAVPVLCVDSPIIEQALSVVQAKGFTATALVPDYALVQAPDEEVSLWQAPAGAVAVRRADGSGFAVGREMLPLMGLGDQTIASDLPAIAGMEAEKLSLLTGRFAPKAGLLQHVGLLRRLGALAAVLIILLGVEYHVETGRIEEQTAAFEARTETLFRETFPAITRIIDPVSQARREVALISAEGGGIFLRLSEQVFAVIQANEALLLEGLRYNQQQGGYFLTVSAPSFAEGDAFRQSLASSGLRVVEGSSRQEDGRIVMELAVEFGQ